MSRERHQAQKIYDGRASFEFRAGRGLKSDYFLVCVAGHIIAECEDSEVADFICKAWNAMAAITKARPIEDSELLIAQKRDEISWLQEAAGRMRIALDKQPDNLGPTSDKTAMRILAVLESQLTGLRGPRHDHP